MTFTELIFSHRNERVLRQGSKIFIFIVLEIVDNFSSWSLYLYVFGNMQERVTSEYLEYFVIAENQIEPIFEGLFVKRLLT